MLAGAAVADITPPAGLFMAGFGARTDPATGAHDPLTVRALVIGDTAILVADVIGLTTGMTARIRAACKMPAGHIVIAALHTHGGPQTMPGHMGGTTDDAYLAMLERAAIRALDLAWARRRPAVLSFGMGEETSVARNRRHPGGPVDAAVPLLRIAGENGGWIAVLASYACHPVVLDATNRHWTADYPFALRRSLEQAHPGAIALFATGAAGDANTGHSAHRSLSLAPAAYRTFDEAERIGKAVAAAALAADQHAVADTPIAIARKTIALDMVRREGETLSALIAQWRRERAGADSGKRALLDIWLDWALTAAKAPLAPFSVEVAVLRWGGVFVVALPGEIFAETGLDIRARVPGPCFVLAYCNDNPGYIAPSCEFASGGYEIDEAHRYYNMPGTFAPGAAEQVRDAALGCVRALTGAEE